ncbi:hypothetical protein I553_1021 [Mycobacterium xenopi 4042]|uniref:Uncharacterized protein n=1 Tax=Mycobacterium xenopi 4042 TaxID=1299334 RepID=X7ZAK8_MYCXE|nr:hypothetical protein I553_1021 [Mycobacterium xenopi 4042]
MNRSAAHRPTIEELVKAYRADLVAAGMFAGHPVTSVARTFFTRIGWLAGLRCRWHRNAHCR